MNTSFEKSKNSTDEWYTPKEIIDALGEFDLDPCAPMRPLWRTARVMYNKEQDGLKQKWEGRVWLNPPYSRPTIEHFITRMVEHNNGIALLFNRLDNKIFQNVVFPKAKGILFMKGRIKFHREDGGGDPGDSSGDAGRERAPCRRVYVYGQDGEHDGYRYLYIKGRG